MVLITNMQDADKTAAIMKTHHAPIRTLLRGEGTASTEILSFLGLRVTEKAVIISTVQKKEVPELFEALNERIRLKKPGTGIAFTLPITGAGLVFMGRLEDDVRQKLMEQMEENENGMALEYNHNLLIITINSGYLDDVMAAAREAGASGGTVLHAHSLGSEGTKKKWGVDVLPEREMILILIGKEKCRDVMAAINEKCGVDSKAQGVVISIPVDAVAGIEI